MKGTTNVVRKRQLKKLCIPEAVMEALKKQICEHYHAEWDDLRTEGYFGDEETDHLIHGMWCEEPKDGGKFLLMGTFIVVPFCTLVDGGQVIATHNLEKIFHAEYQQAEVNLYQQVQPHEPSYLFYTADDSTPATLFKIQPTA